MVEDWPQVGILVLQGNRTHGRDPRSQRLLYRCVPFWHAHHAPCLLPYAQKHVGLSKHVDNLCVEYTHKVGDAHGQLRNVLGPVTDTRVYQQYLLLAHRLQGLSAKRTRIPPPVGPDPWLAVRGVTTTSVVATIDAQGTVYHDDALSFQDHTVSVYLADVPSWLRRFQCVEWVTELDRVATLYTPSGALPMLPSWLLQAASLDADGQTKHATVLQLVLGPTDDGCGRRRIVDMRVELQEVRITHAWTSETAAHEPLVQSWIQRTREVALHVPFAHAPVTCPSTLVAFWMTAANHWSAQALLHQPDTLFRTHQGYTTRPEPHIHLALPYYATVTSPLRRLPDLLNLSRLQEIALQSATNQGGFQEVRQYWSAHVDRVRTQWRFVRRVQAHLSLLQLPGWTVLVGTLARIESPDEEEEDDPEERTHLWARFPEHPILFPVYDVPPVYQQVGSTHRFRLFTFAQADRIHQRCRWVWVTAECSEDSPCRTG